MPKRTVTTIKQFDYTSKEEFQNDILEMRKKGYYLIKDGMYNSCLEPQEIEDGKWHYTAYFAKSSMM